MNARRMLVVAALALAVLAWYWAPSAQAGGFDHGHRPVYRHEYHPAYHYYAPPVVVRRPPVVVVPPPIYVQPAPVVVQPAPVVVQPACPAPVAVPPWAP
jgi:hypothetical protein